VALARGKQITEEWWYVYWSAAGKYYLQPPARLQFISTLCTTRCVTAVQNKLSVIESLVYLKRSFLQSWPLFLVYLGLFGLRLRHHDVLEGTGCSYHRELDELSYIRLEASSPDSFCCVSGCAICQNYMFWGKFNTISFFRRLKQIWKNERLKTSQKHGPRAYLIVVGWRHMCVFI